MKRLLKSNIFGLSLLLGLSFILIYITDKYILSVGFYNENGDIFSGMPGQDARIYDAFQKWIYITDALYTLLTVFVIAFIIHTALYLIDEPVPYRSVLNTVIYCEYIFLIPAAIKIPWFLYKYPHGTLLDWHRTYIFSALCLFDNVPADWYYPLEAFNIFEIAYWFLLAYGVSKITRLDFDRSLRTIVFSYVPALLIWIAAIAFCTVVTFPQNG